MRLPKSENMKAVNLTVSVPASFAQYLRDQGDPSFAVQRHVAQEILGPGSMERHWETYSERPDVPDIRYKPEPLKKSWIRTARWILESVITRAWQSADRNQLVFEVDWLLTDKKGMLCFIDLNMGPGFVHVVYDNEISFEALYKLEFGQVTDIRKPEALETQSKRYKWSVALAWFTDAFAAGGSI